MTFDKDATVNVNELLNLVKSHSYDISYLRGGTVNRDRGVTITDFERLLKDVTRLGLKQKVISGLEHCSRLRETRSCENCPYIDDDFCTITLKLDALKVLK